MQANPAVTASQNVMNIAEKEMIYQWVLDIPNPETREKALLELRFQLIIYFFDYRCTCTSPLLISR